MKNRFTTLLIAFAMLFCIVTTDTLSAASTGYFNTYSNMNTKVASSSFTTMQGMEIDRYNDEAYFIRINKSTGYGQLVQASYKSNTTPQVVKYKTTSGASSATYFGHGNDIAIVAEKGATNISLYVATMDEGTYANKIVKLNVNRVNCTYTVAATYSLTYNGSALSISGITYSAGNDKFIVKSGNKFFIGSFSGSTFVYEATFSLDYANVTINGSTVDCSDFTKQGICYYKGILYVPMMNDTKKSQSVVACYKFSIPSLISKASGTTAFSTKVTAMSNLSFRITSSEYSNLFEIECVAFDDGVMYFNTNRSKSSDTNADGIHCFKEYVAAD